MPRPCESAHVLSPESCELCRLYEESPAYRKLWGGRTDEPKKSKSLALIKCNHRTEHSIGKCTSCGGAAKYGCSIYGETTVGKCFNCKDHTARLAFADQAEKAAYLPSGKLLSRFDNETLPFSGRMRINTSITKDARGYIACYRDDRFDARLHILRLEEDFKPIPESFRTLKFDLPKEQRSLEDPRLFWHQDRLHVAFYGVKNFEKKRVETTIFYARLDSTLQVEETYCPRYALRQWPMEKNWSFFSHESSLYAVYYSNPKHQILQIDGSEANLVFSTDNTRPYTGSEIRGGCSPILYDGCYWHFFHTRGHPERGFSLRYDMGLIRFEAKPPFQVIWQSNKPIYKADPSTWRHQYWAAPVWFPTGAIRAEGGWVISGGVHERWSEVMFFSDSEVERSGTSD